MTVEYEVIDNFLDEEDFYNIQSVMMSSALPWFYTSSVNSAAQVGKSFYFVHLFHIDGIPGSPFIERLDPLIKKLGCESIIRIKGNMYPNLGFPYEDGMHIDYQVKHKGAILYINNNDGCTILEDGTRIESVANRVLLFDPSKPHDSSYPTDAKVRVNININFK